MTTRHDKMTVITHIDGMTDVTVPELVEIIITEDKSRIWINVDGKCVFRAYRVRDLIIDLGDASRRWIREDGSITTEIGDDT